jgi:hypothetical protein
MLNEIVEKEGRSGRDLHFARGVVIKTYARIETMLRLM